MAAQERKSKPRKVEPKAEDTAKAEGQGLRLAMMGVAAIAIIVGMIVLAMFLANADGRGPPMELLVTFGALAALWAALWGAEFMRRRKAA